MRAGLTSSVASLGCASARRTQDAPSLTGLVLKGVDLQDGTKPMSNDTTPATGKQNQALWPSILQSCDATHLARQACPTECWQRGVCAIVVVRHVVPRDAANHHKNS